MISGSRLDQPVALSAHPLANERRTVGQHDTGPFNLGEKPNHLDIEERDLVQIQLCPSAGFELTANVVEVLRTDTSKQPDRVTSPRTSFSILSTARQTSPVGSMQRSGPSQRRHDGDGDQRRHRRIHGRHGCNPRTVRKILKTNAWGTEPGADVSEFSDLSAAGQKTAREVLVTLKPMFVDAERRDL